MVSTARQGAGEKEEKTVLGERSERRGVQSREVAGKKCECGRRRKQVDEIAGKSQTPGAPEFNGGLALKETRVSVSS